MLPAEISAWCAAELGSAPRRDRFQTGHLSLVFGVDLEDGTPVVIKARPADPRLPSCAAVQRHVWRRGFPCPEPLAGPDRIGPLMVSAERLVEGGAPVPPTPATVPAFAGLLRCLVTSAPAPEDVPALAPAPPWVRWDHGERGTWPEPDDLDLDLNDPSGPAWIEEIGRRVRGRLLAAAPTEVVGHVDWEAHNLAWRAGDPRAVHDWDSAALRPEPAIAGAASAVFASLGPVVAASTEQSQSFLVAYQAAMGGLFSVEELETAWAAGLWVLAFNARKEAARAPAGPYQAGLLGEAEERLRRAGA